MKFAFILLFVCSLGYSLPIIKKIPEKVLETDEKQNSVVFIYKNSDPYQREMLSALKNERKHFGVFSYDVDAINEENLMTLTGIIADENVRSVCVATAEVPDAMLRLLVQLEKMIVFADARLPNAVGKFAVEKVDETKFGEMLVDGIANIILNEGDVAVFTPKEQDEYSKLFLQGLLNFSKISRKRHSKLALIEIPDNSEEKIAKSVEMSIRTYPNLKAIISVSPNLTQEICRAMEDQFPSLRVPVTGILTPSGGKGFLEGETMPFFVCWNPDISGKFLAQFYENQLCGNEFPEEIRSEAHKDKTFFYMPPYKYDSQNLDRWSDIF